MKTIRIIEDKNSGRIGGEIICNDDIAKRYVSKGNAVYVERKEVEEEKPKRVRKPKEEPEIKEAK